jgi:hypothetical protein
MRDDALSQTIQTRKICASNNILHRAQGPGLVYYEVRRVKRNIDLRYGPDMPIKGHITVILASAVLALLYCDPAFALRCGTRLVKDGMSEFAVRALCGEPTSVRHVGFVLRAYRRTSRPYPGSVEYAYPMYGFPNELVVTELLYNFGPRKLMRKLRFEGDRLTKIETAGYGFLERNE